MSKETKGLIYQLVAIAAAFAALVIWLVTADLTDTERQTLDPGTIWKYTQEHLQITLVSAVIVLLIAIPLGILLTRPSLRKAAPAVRAVANFGQAAPAIGVIVLLAFWLGFGPKTAVVSLVIYAILPVLSNTIVGLQQVDERLVEAGRGIGMSQMAVLFKVELPLPVMLSGIRTALVLLVGTATLATFINGGGLGILITTGVNLNLNVVLIAGSLMVALLALTVDWIGRLVEQLARPKGLS